MKGSTPAAKQRDECLGDFWTFMKVALEMPLSEKPHQEMGEYISEELQMNKMMLVPRDCWKTSVASTAYPLWMVLRAWFLDKNAFYRCLLDAETRNLSQYVLTNIVSYVRYSESFKKIFGDLYVKGGDQRNALSLSFRVHAGGGIKEPNFLASGLKASKTGLHFELIVMDDLVTKENVTTLAQRERVWTHYRMMQGIIESSKTEGQQTQMIVTGTRYADDDLYGRILKQDKIAIANGVAPVFAPMIRGAIDDDGELFFPEKLPYDELARRKQIMGSLFFAQMMNDPNSEGAPFKPEQLRVKPRSEFPDLRFIRLTIDPAIKQEQVAHGDYTCMIVGGWDRWNTPYMIDVVLRRDMTVGTFIDEVLRLALIWQVDQVIIEDNEDPALRVLLRRAQMEQGVAFPILFKKPSRTEGKMTRWRRIQPYAERGGVVIAEEIHPSTMVEIRDQWERAPFATYDDFMDALQLQVEHLPVDLRSADSRVVKEYDGERNVGDLADASSAIEREYGVPTLATLFPHIKALQLKPEAPDDEERKDSEMEQLAYVEFQKMFGDEREVSVA